MIILIIVLCFMLSSSQEPTIHGSTLTEKLSPTQFAPKKEQCRIFLLRHAETSWNVISKPQGWEDVPLNAKGKAQAQALGEYFSNLSISAIYASPLSRAKDTAQAMASYHPRCKVIYDSSLRFYDPDQKKKKTEAEIAAEITEQATAYLKNLAKKHCGENIVIITHGKVIKHLLVSLGNYKLEDVKISNTAMVEVIVEGKELILGVH